MSSNLDTYRKDFISLYPDSFFKMYYRARSFQKEFGIYFVRNLNVNSVLDLGCACGWYIEGFYEAGVKDVYGIEFGYESAKKYIPQSIYDKVVFGDLTTPINLNRKFDLSISLEVGEHLPEEGAEIYIQNITNHTEKYILFSVAENADGHMHINVKPRSYWLDILKKNNFIVSESLTNLARNTFREIPVRSKYKNYMSKTVYMMEKI